LGGTLREDPWRWPAHCRAADGRDASGNTRWRIRDRAPGEAVRPDAPDGLAGHALLRPADRQLAASAVLAGAGAVGARRRWRGVPARPRRCLRKGLAAFRPGTRIWHRPVGP